MKKHYMLKPRVESFPSLPEFEIQQVNKLYKNGPMSVIDFSTVIIRDWSQIIEIDTPDKDDGNYGLTVRDPERVPTTKTRKNWQS